MQYSQHCGAKTVKSEDGQFYPIQPQEQAEIKNDDFSLTSEEESHTFSTQNPVLVSKFLCSLCQRSFNSQDTLDGHQCVCNDEELWGRETNDQHDFIKRYRRPLVNNSLSVLFAIKSIRASVI
eukprot:483107_1